MHFTVPLLRIAVAMSGGVDSAVAALLLKRQGLPIEGVYMVNWSQIDEFGTCTSDSDYKDVIDVREHIGIPCRRAEFVRDYWNEVFSHFLQEIQHGRTPNPDVLCNEKIKFGVFQRYIIKTMGVFAMATGHYAQIDRMNDGTVRLLKGVDEFKDQTFFLSTVSHKALQKTLFPIGHLTKSQVRKIAQEAGLHRTARRKESMGVCFIGKRRFPKFIEEYIEERPGLFISHDGHVIGEHRGHHYYTIGQRARIGGQTHSWFVSKKNAETNVVTIVEGSTNPSLYCHAFTTSPPCWIRERAEVEEECFQARYRHQQELFWCKVSTNGHKGLNVYSEIPLRAVTPGQYVVFYNGEECIGGACIKTLS